MFWNWGPGVNENEWKEPNSFIENFENNIYFNEKKYVTRLPLKDNNYENMKHKLFSLKNKLYRNK